ncbi:CIR protein, partial [Plasmodium chabaudi chabaudi]
MQNHKRMCKLLLEGDSYFNDENVDTEKINKDITIKGYCRNGSCKTNEESISALTSYIFKKFKDSIVIKRKYNHYDECLLMWVSDKLFKVHLKNIGKKDVINYMDGTTLNQAYEKYLEKNKGTLDYWTLFNIIGDLKEANLKYMSEYYKLLNKICKIITDYNNNGVQTKQFYKYPADCSLQYKNLYLNISKCKPYLDLLNKLKGIYDDFRNYAIKNNSSNSELATKLKKLTPKDGKEMKAVRGFKTYDISNTKCKFFPPKNTNPKKAVKSPLQSSNQLKGGQQETPPAHKPEIKEQSSPQPAPQSPQAPASDIQIDSPGSQGRSAGASDQLPTHGDKSQNSDDGQHNPAGNSETTKKQAGISTVQDKSQENNATTPENTGKENAQRSDIPDTGNKGDELKGSGSISQDKQEHQPPEEKNPPKESSSELKDNVKELDNTQTDTDTQDGSNPEPKTKQDKTDTPKGTDTGTGNTKDNANIGESRKEGSNSVTEKQITDSKSGITSGGTGHVNSDKGGADLGTGDPGSKAGDSGSGTGGTSGNTRSPNSENEKKSGGAKEPGDPSGGKGSQANGGDRANSEPGGGSADKVSETGDPGNGKGASKGGTGGDQGSPGSGTRDTSNVPGGEQIDQGSPGSGTSDTNRVPGGQISNGTQGGGNT